MAAGRNEFHVNTSVFAHLGGTDVLIKDRP